MNREEIENEIDSINWDIYENYFEHHGFREVPYCLECAEDLKPKQTMNGGRHKAVCPECGQEFIYHELMVRAYAVEHGWLQLRSKLRKLSKDDVKSMMEKYDFYAGNYNPYGNFKNYLKDNRDGTINDRATGLMWEQGGSSGVMRYEEASEYVESLNREKFAGFSDWRLPTLEELASLLKPKGEDGLYIDPIFDRKQTWCWAADRSEGVGAWNVRFDLGRVRWYSKVYSHYVRVCRP